ncbi:MAG: glycosyltransferase [Clostridia bacterium]|nr:glycosyltransferase [Clostridia bacterium]
MCEEYDITIFTIYAKGELEKQLSQKVKLKSLYDKPYVELSKFQRKIAMPLKILLTQKVIYHKKIKEDYDIEIAFLEGAITRILSTKNRNTKKIAWVHNDISLVFGKGIKAKLKKKIDAKIYAKYQKLIFVSKENQEKFEKVYNNLKNIDKEVIYNYIDQNSIVEKAKENLDISLNKDTINFVTVARLVEQKAIDRLIEVHSQLVEQGLKHHFYVIGDGPEKDNLQQLIKKKNVENTFHLLGKKENPYPYIKAGDYFCLLSHFEGYPMVLLEAQILQKPIVITDTSARETLQNYEDYQIAENSAEGIYQTLKEIIENSKTEKTPRKEYSNQDLLGKIKRLLEN